MPRFGKVRDNGTRGAMGSPGEKVLISAADDSATLTNVAGLAHSRRSTPGAIPVAVIAATSLLKIGRVFHGFQRTI
jgi:hypothetical protein